MQKRILLALLVLSNLYLLNPVLAQQNSWVTSQQMFDSTKVVADRTNGGLVVFGDLYHREEVGTPGSSVHSFDQAGNLRWRLDFNFPFNFEDAGLNVVPAGPDQWLLVYDFGLCLNGEETIDYPQFELVDRLSGERTMLSANSQSGYLTAFAVDENVEYIYLATETELLRREITGDEFESYYDYTFDLIDPAVEVEGPIFTYMLRNNVLLLVRGRNYRTVDLTNLTEDIITMGGASATDVYLGNNNFYVQTGSVIFWSDYDNLDLDFVLNVFEGESKFVDIDQDGFALLFSDGSYERYNNIGTELLGQGTIDLDLGRNVRASYRDRQLIVASEVGLAESPTEHFASLYTVPLDSDTLNFTIERESDINLAVENIVLDSLVPSGFPIPVPPRAYLTATVSNESDQTLENLTIIETERDWEAGCVPVGSGLPYRRYHYIDGLSIAPGATGEVSFFVENFLIDDNDFEFDLSLSFNFPNQRLEDVLTDNDVNISINNTQNFLPASAWSISPNPISTGQDLRLDTKINEPLDWSIFSLSGQLLRQGITESSTTAIRHGLTNPGLYLLRIQTNSGVGTKRFVLN